MTGRIDPANLDSLLLQRGMTLSELRQKSGISSATLARIHAGQPVHLQTIKRIAVVLKQVPVQPEIGALLAS